MVVPRDGQRIRAFPGNVIATYSKREAPKNCKEFKRIRSKGPRAEQMRTPRMKHLFHSV